jgi:flagellar export protein FliJ
MPFRYRLQKILDFRIRKKEEQLQNVRNAQTLVLKIEGLIERNNKEIAATRANMRQADFSMYESYDNFLKHLYVKGENLETDRQKAQEELEIEKDKLRELEKAVKVLEKHKEHSREAYIEEEKAAELKTLSEIAVQRHFAKTRDQQEEELAELLKNPLYNEGIESDEY